jgi:hypothetical protein
VENLQKFKRYKRELFLLKKIKNFFSSLDEFGVLHWTKIKIL